MGAVVEAARLLDAVDGGCGALDADVVETRTGTVGDVVGSTARLWLVLAGGAFDVVDSAPRLWLGLVVVGGGSTELGVVTGGVVAPSTAGTVAFPDCRLTSFTSLTSLTTLVAASASSRCRASRATRSSSYTPCWCLFEASCTTLWRAGGSRNPNRSCNVGVCSASRVATLMPRPGVPAPAVMATMAHTKSTTRTRGAGAIASCGRAGSRVFGVLWLAGLGEAEEVEAAFSGLTLAGVVMDRWPPGKRRAVWRCDDWGRERERERARVSERERA